MAIGEAVPSEQRVSMAKPKAVLASALPPSLDPRRLNIEERSRTSRLPWRGQFSPELIEYLMTDVCPTGQTYLDPFCGSGTVLYEAISRGCDAIGLEINPAAWHLAALASTNSLSSTQASTLAKSLRDITGPSSYTAGELYEPNGCPNVILDHIQHASTESSLKLALAATVLLGMGNRPELTHDAISRGSFQVLSVLKELSQKNTASNCECRLADARYTEISDESIDAVITSPPYINVFNYHQNYRPAAEMLGWNVLEAARTEIGSNRKHRMNRFLTVTQYCLDMSLFIDEMSRVIRPKGHFIIVLGRTSNVLGCSFRNGDIIHSLIKSSGAFETPSIFERVFTNRFGERIYEDIIISRRDSRGQVDKSVARQVGRMALEEALPTVSAANKSALVTAIEQVSAVQPSPQLTVTVPSHFKKIKGIF